MPRASRRVSVRAKRTFGAAAEWFVGQFNVDAGQGGAFGIGIAMTGTNTARLAVVDDNANDQNL